MGLDMFLYKRNKNSKGDEREEICYWRKANAILNWFDHNLNEVKNQNVEENENGFGREGVQNTTYYRVSKEECEKLLSDCKNLLANRKDIPNDLQPTSGFFFGNYEINDWYWDDIQDTVKMLEESLPNIDWDNDIVEFYIWY